MHSFQEDTHARDRDVRPGDVLLGRSRHPRRRRRQALLHRALRLDRRGPADGPRRVLHHAHASDGRAVAALYPQEPAALRRLRRTGCPTSRWRARTTPATRAKELGGTVLDGPVRRARRRVGWRWCRTRPARWSRCGSRGATRAPGSSASTSAICWNELGTDDTARAGAFYTDLFGWAAETQPMGHGTYTMFTQGGSPRGGMIADRTGRGAGAAALAGVLRGERLRRAGRAGAIRSAARCACRRPTSRASAGSRCCADPQGAIVRRDRAAPGMAPPGGIDSRHGRHRRHPAADLGPPFPSRPGARARPSSACSTARSGPPTTS